MSATTAALPDCAREAQPSPSLQNRGPDEIPHACSGSEPHPEFCCRFCGSPDLCLTFVYPDRDGSATEIHLCRQCQALVPRYSLDMRPQAVLELQTRFHEQWWPTLSQEEARELSAGSDGIVSFYHSRLKPEHGLVLEIGAGRGALVDALRRAGYEALGCEPAEGLVSQARRVYRLERDVLYCLEADRFLQIVAASGRKVQAVFLWHVLEHLHQPLTLLRQIHQVLDDQGLIIAQVPLVEKQYIYPAHLFFLTEPAVKYGASACGCIVEETNYDLDRKYMAMVLRKANAGPSRPDCSPARLLRQSPVAMAKDRGVQRPAIFNRITSGPSLDPAELIRDAEQSLRDGDLNWARQTLRNGLVSDPCNTELLEMLGNVEWTMGSLRAAKDLFALAAMQRPESIAAHFKAAAISLELGQLTEAETFLNAARALAPTQPEVLKLLGNLGLRRNCFAEAAQAFEALLQQNSTDIESLLALVKCYYQLGDSTAARNACQRVLELDPDNSLARENLAVLERASQSPAPLTPGESELNHPTVL